MIDLHTHTVFSDGELIPEELARRAAVAGYTAVVLTDHAGPSNIELIVSNQRKMTEKYGHFFDVDVYTGVELTHVPPALIPEAAEMARKAGAGLVVVHGETIVEPVAEGTNLAAIEAGVEVLAHPGLITDQEAALAAEKGVALELTSRRGHCFTNGHVAAMAKKHGAKLVINNDAHAPGDFISRDLHRKLALGAGLTIEDYRQTEENARRILQKMLRL